MGGRGASAKNGANNLTFVGRNSAGMYIYQYPNGQQMASLKPIKITQQQQPQQNQQQQQQQPTRGQSTNGHDLIANWNSGFDNNGDPNVAKWQAQTDDDKSGRYLSRVNNEYTFQNGQFTDRNGNVISDTHAFYDGSYQKFSLAMNLNGKPQIMDDKAFDQMVKTNHLQVVYRGESGDAAADRLMYDDYGHTGVGNYGDGYYFSTSHTDAIDYARYKSHNNGQGTVCTMVLSPTARAIKYSDLQAAWNKLSPQAQARYTKAGQSANASYNNRGEAQLALRMGYNVVACDTWGRSYCYALDRSAFIIKKSTQHY